ncbi:MAG: hypothetical protein JST49_03700 [Bacteroidetes bacterium]|nr:hypothetical protein [Bacteroidota bacterium]
MKQVCRLICFCTILLFAFTGTSLAQTMGENMLVASDSEFVMQVVRMKGEITLTVHFTSADPQFDYIAIERKPFGETNFSQCKYISYAEAKAANMHITRKDNYPLPRTSDVLYRLKITTKEGIIRIFPPIRLASLDSN